MIKFAGQDMKQGPSGVEWATMSVLLVPPSVLYKADGIIKIII